MTIDFQFVPTSGSLPGKDFESQTEQAINELGGQIDTGNDTAQQALDVANNALTQAGDALQTAQAANQVAQDASTTANAAQASANAAQTAADNAQAAADAAQTTANGAQAAASTAQASANAAQTAADNAQAAADAAQTTANNAEDYANFAITVASGRYTSTPDAIDLNDAEYTLPTKLYLTNTANINLPPGQPATDAPFFLEVRATDDGANVIQILVAQSRPGIRHIRSGETADDGSGGIAVTWGTWSATGLGDVLELTGATLTRAIGGTTAVAKSLFPAGTAFIANQSIIFDSTGSLGVYRGDADATSINIQTYIISPLPGDTSSLLGNVATYADLPTTVSGATSTFGRTPALDDYARVLADETHGGSTVEYYVTALDTGADTISWGNEIIINTSDYQAQTAAADAGKVPVIGATSGAWGTPRAIEEAAPAVGSDALITSDAVARVLSAASGIPLFSVIGVPLTTVQPGFASVTQDNGVMTQAVYPDAYAQLVALQTAGETNIVTMDAYAAELAANGGICGKFALDATAQTFRIPCAPGAYWRGASDALAIGAFQTDQMRAITGGFLIGHPTDGGYGAYGATGAFAPISNSQVYWGGSRSGAASGGVVSINTALLGPNYSGNDSHPLSVVTDYQMKLYGTVSHLGELNLAQLITAIDGKLDTSTWNAVGGASLWCPSGSYVDLPIPASGGLFTAPGDGWVSLRGASANGFCHISCGGIASGCPSGLDKPHVFLPVRSGAVGEVFYAGVIQLFRFAPSVGAS